MELLFLRERMVDVRSWPCRRRTRDGKGDLDDPNSRALFKPNQRPELDLIESRRFQQLSQFREKLIRLTLSK